MVARAHHSFGGGDLMQEIDGMLRIGGGGGGGGEVDAAIFFQHPKPVGMKPTGPTSRQ